MINPLHIINAIRSPYLYLDVAEDIEVFSDSINIGNRAVTARCRYRGSEGDALLKCYYRSIGHGVETYGERFHANALRVYTIGGNTEFADVLLYRWVEGEPLDVCIGDRAYDLHRLSRAFDRMALDLLNEEWAHGDVKPENIIYRPDRAMQLIDMDAVWREGVDIERCNEYGTAEFNHPRRGEMTEGKHIDDFAIALISTTLAIMALDPERYRLALDTRRRIFLPWHIAEGSDIYFNYALTQLLEAGDKAHYNIGAALRTDNGIIPNLRELLMACLRADYTLYDAPAELSIAADITTPTDYR